MKALIRRGLAQEALEQYQVVGGTRKGHREGNVVRAPVPVLTLPVCAAFFSMPCVSSTRAVFSPHFPDPCTNVVGRVVLKI